DVGVRQDDHVVLGSSQRLHALSISSGGLVDLASHRCRTYEGDMGDLRVVQQTRHGRAIALNHGKYTGREPRIAPKLRESKRGRRILFTWLEDEAVAA